MFDVAEQLSRRTETARRSALFRNVFTYKSHKQLPDFRFKVAYTVHNVFITFC